MWRDQLLLGMTVIYNVGNSFIEIYFQYPLQKAHLLPLNVSLG